MTEVQTARGPIDTSALGRTLMHEHIFVLTPDVQQNLDEWDEQEQVTNAIAKLTELKQAGFDTIVDPTVIGLGRYIPRIEKLAAEVDLNIIVATGVYTFFELPMFLKHRDHETLAGIFVREIREGINDTGVKAAFLKCAVDLYGIGGDVQRVLAACAAASLETGAPVMVHTNAKLQTGLPALHALLELGVDPARIVISHAGDSPDLDYLRAIADTGASLGYDRFNMTFYESDETRLHTLTTLLAEGYGDRVHLSHDASSFWDPAVQNPLFDDEVLDYLHISTTILPALRDAGVTQAQIDQMLVGNPRRFFGG